MASSTVPHQTAIAEPHLSVQRIFEIGSGEDEANAPRPSTKKRKGNFRCQPCDKYFTQMKSLWRHWRDSENHQVTPEESHHFQMAAKESHDCSQCATRFKRLHDKERHEKRFHGIDARRIQRETLPTAVVPAATALANSTAPDVELSPNITSDNTNADVPIAQHNFDALDEDDIDALDEDDTSALYRACSKGDVKTTELLISKGADVNLPGGSYGLPLCAAVHSGHLECVNFLLERGARGNINWNISRYASTQTIREAPVLEFPIDDEDVQDPWGFDLPYSSPLRHAIMTDHFDLARKLIRKGAVFHGPSDASDGLNDILYLGDFLYMVSFLIDNNLIKLNGRTGSFGTPILYGCHYGRAGTVTKLLKMGAQTHRPDDCNSWMDSCLALACEAGHVPVVKTLLEHGAKLEEGILSRTVDEILDIVTEGSLVCANYVQVMVVLLAHGVEPDSRVDGDKSCLWNVLYVLAVQTLQGFERENLLAALTLLLDYGAIVDSYCEKLIDKQCFDTGSNEPPASLRTWCRQHHHERENEQCSECQKDHEQRHFFHHMESWWRALRDSPLPRSLQPSEARPASSTTGLRLVARGNVSAQLSPFPEALPPCFDDRGARTCSWTSFRIK